MTPQQKDRWLQVFLTQARGPARNGDLLRQAVDRALRITRARMQAVEYERMDDALIQTLTEVSRVLEGLDLPYAVTGSIASSVHGEVLQSMGADVVLQSSASDAARIAALLSPRFYAPADRLAEAASRHAFANVIDNRTGLKVDLSFVGDDPYLNRVLGRRTQTRIGSDPTLFWFVTPEDVILMKLLWRKETRSLKQWENALGVLRVRGSRMDWKYLFEQAGSLNLENELVALRDEAGI